AEGWFAGQIGWEGNTFRYGDSMSLLVQLEIVYTDGTRQIVVTDGDWYASLGPITYAGNFAGEGYDARREFAGWDKPGADPAGWTLVRVDSAPVTAVTLVARVDPPVRVMGELKPVSVTRLATSGSDAIPGPVTIFDMGQNMVGWARLRVNGPAGTMVRLRF